jgi:hypothetical protein
MTVSTEVSREEYTGNGVTTDFDYRFRVFKAEDLVVSVADTTETITVLTLNTDYTVTGAGSRTGGKVKLFSPLAFNWQISIERALPVTQETDIRNQGNFFPEVHEDVFDKLTMLIQQVWSYFGLALRKPTWLAKYYDALGNRIANLGNPINPQDAATKSYVDTAVAESDDYADDLFKRTLRVPEGSVGMIADVETRKNMLLGFNNIGNPAPIAGQTETADLAIKLAATTGGFLVGSPDNIQQLRLTLPASGARLKTKGAFSSNDGGGGWWVFESGNRATQVATMPNIWIAPLLFPDGSQGAWRPDFSEGIWVNRLGYAITADTGINDTILEQVINIYNNKGERVNLPAGVAAHHKMTWKRDPHLEGVAGAIAGLNTGTGTVFLFTDELTTDDCIRIAPETGRITGLTLKNITVLSKEIFVGGPPTTFKTRTNRVAISGNTTGGQIEVDNNFIVGFKQAFRSNELWDGANYGMRGLYCGIESVVPAFWFGSDATDNTNNLHMYGLHIEFCPYALYMGLCRNISIYGGKIETNRSEDATGYVVNLSIGVFEAVMSGTMFVQSTFNTKSPFMLNQGRGVRLEACDFISPNYSPSFKYTGIVWYHGNDVNASENVLRDVRFDNALSTDSVTGVDYPIFAGNNESGSIRVTVPSNAVGGGVVSLGANCSMSVNVVTNTSGSAKPGGTIHFRAAGSSVELRRPAGTVLGTYATGDRNNVLNQNIPIKTAYNTAVPDVTGHQVVYVGAAGGVSITAFSGMAGHMFSVRLGTGSATLINSGSLKLKGGSNIAMTANTLYTFTVIDSNNNCEQN